MNGWRAIPCLLCAGLSILSVSLVAAAQDSPAQPVNIEGAPLGVDEIVSRMEERNREQTEALRRFEGTRVYRIQYRGFFGSRDAEMVVGVKGSLVEKQFTIESQSGSKFIIDHVLKKLLEGETEASTDENRRRTALSASNYTFTLAGYDESLADPEYMLNVVPKTDEKFLYRGKIWVNAKDFAVTRIKAEPAKTPSMWIKKTDINHTYEKLGNFWLPVENESNSWIRLGGHAVLSIEYKDYKITEMLASNPRTNALQELVTDAK